MESSRPTQVSGGTLEGLTVTSNPPESTSAHPITQKPQGKSRGGSRKGIREMQMKSAVRYDFACIRVDTGVHQVSKPQHWQG